MNRNFRMITLICIILLLVTGCDHGFDVKTTDLSDISIDGIKIHADINTVDLSRYTPSEKYSGAYAYKFDELVINVDEDEIIYLFAPFNDGKVEVLVDNAAVVTKIEVEALLGTNYESGSQDHEQRLRYSTYYDHEHNIKASFVYSEAEWNQDQLIFIYLTRNRKMNSVSK